MPCSASGRQALSMESRPGWSGWIRPAPREGFPWVVNPNNDDKQW